MARRRPLKAKDFDGRTRLPAVDKRAHTLLAPASRGFGMNGPMRLVAMTLMLWDEYTERDRIEWDHDQLADRTGLTVAQVADALDKLRQVHLVQETASGPKLTWEPFERYTLKAWRDRYLMRPTALTGSPQQSNPGRDHVSDQVEDGGQAVGREVVVGD